MPASKKFSLLGFTLIELLVVIAIIGVLSAIAIVALSTVSKNGRDAKRLTDLRTIQGALEQYYADNSQYPPYLNDLLQSGGTLNDPEDPTKIYYNKLPKDPSGDSGRKYTYSSFKQNGSRCNSNDEGCITYCVYATFENLDNICNESNRYIPNGECPNFTANNAQVCVGDNSKDTANFALTPP